MSRRRGGPRGSRGARRGPPARRRRPVQTMATLALLLAPLAVAAAVYLAFAPSDDGGGGGAGLPIAVHTPPHAVRGVSAAQPERAEPPPGVDLAGVDAFHLALRKPPRAGLVFDLGDGEVLWRREPLRVMPIASLTKIMTALVVVERTRPAERVRITQAALNYTGSGIGLLPKGRRVRAGGAAERAAARVGQRRGDRAGGARVGQRAALRGADEPARPAGGGCAAPTSRRRTGSRTATARARATWRC